MKTSFLLIVAFTLFISNPIASQDLTQKQLEREKNKVEIYTPNEKDSIQMSFYNQANKMGLSEKNREKYNRIITDFVFDMKRVNDKDKDLSAEEMEEKLLKLEVKSNNKVKQILNQEQFEKHKKVFGDLVSDAIIKLKK
ncbi:hypothetical protein RXV94_13020 [Yeosuana sp. MJ-SS3]|uniref:Uncharacterized protein n=1 Tax=Gilvirhabdus luticola TaxID=3079858 RepID=A0ABU3UAF8_9FLAO|nr:hypothetical protein [Yeosuana sp. MJ-SS3]MDU8887085.1 hypothetical protein [Yeosuana sp. MJ-SS3]